MPDISMCSNQECFLRARCHRFTAKPSEYRQSYFIDVSPNKNGKCEHFWENSEYESERAMDAMTLALYGTEALRKAGHDETAIDSLALAIWMGMSPTSQQVAIDMAIRQGQNHPEPDDIFIAAGLGRVR
jgi:hypothetical protein